MKKMICRDSFEKTSRDEAEIMQVIGSNNFYLVFFCQMSGAMLLFYLNGLLAREREIFFFFDWIMGFACFYLLFEDVNWCEELIL